MNEINGNIESINIKDLNVTTAKLDDGAVTTVKIADANITTSKIADGNVTTSKIADSNVTTSKIADSAITNAKIANDAITNSKIADDAVQAENINGLTGTGSVDLSKIPGTTDDITEGSTNKYFSGKTLDDLPDGSTYIRLLDKIHIGNGTKANSDGDQVITGVGFRPRIIIFFAAADDGTQDLSWGFDDGTNHMCLYYGSDDTQNINSSYSITIAHSVSSNPYVIRGYVSALSSDGFTITWSTVGYGNTARFTYLCLP